MINFTGYIRFTSPKGQTIEDKEDLKKPYDEAKNTIAEKEKYGKALWTYLSTNKTEIEKCFYCKQTGLRVQFNNQSDNNTVATLSCDNDYSGEGKKLDIYTDDFADNNYQNKVKDAACAADVFVSHMR